MIRDDIYHYNYILVWSHMAFTLQYIGQTMVGTT